MRRIDPGDAVPPGVAPEQPVPLTEGDRAARRQLDRLGKPGGERPGTPVHDWLKPRLSLLLDEAAEEGFGRDVAVAVMIDILGEPELLAVPPPEPDDGPDIDPGQPVPPPASRDEGAEEPIDTGLTVPRRQPFQRSRPRG